jgi:hypothetical protein
MKLSQREAVLLFVLGIIVIIFVGLNFLIKPAIAQNIEKQSSYDEFKFIPYSDSDRYKIAWDNRSADYTAIFKCDTAAQPFSLSIKQYEIDRFITKLVKENNIVKKSIKISEVEISNADYNSVKVSGDTGDTEIPIEQSAEIINGSKSTNSTTDETLDTDGTNLMYCTTVNLVVSGKHSKILSFIDDLYKDGRAIIIDELSISTSTDSSNEKASLTIRFFKAPSIKIN